MVKSAPKMATSFESLVVSITKLNMSDKWRLKKMLDEQIIQTTEEATVSQPSRTPITDRIAALDLPVGNWEQMEIEIKMGRAEN